jgi:SgrR family transcriptional regulator
MSVFEDYYRERALLDEIDLWVIEGSEEKPEFDLHFGYTCCSSTTQNSFVQVLPGCTSVVCNPARPFFENAAQRLALADWLAPAVLIASDDGSRKPASGLLPEWEHRVATPRGRPPIPEHTRLTMITIRTDERLALAALIRDRLKAAQIELDVVALGFTEYLQHDWWDSADLVLRIESMNPDKDLGFYEWLASNTLLRQWMPPDRRRLIDEQLREIRANADAQARMRECAAIGKQLVEEGWLIPISHEIRHVHVEAHVAGVKNMSFGLVPFADLWLQ